jgi:hypothetical protein
MNSPIQSAPPRTIIFLCANKVDCPPEKWKVEKEEYISFAIFHNLTIFETSALSGRESYLSSG